MNTQAAEQPAETRFMRWHARVLALCLVIFAFELGIFLLIFPWLPSWDINWIPVHLRVFSDLWMNQYFRGALSGLGMLNIYVAALETKRLIRILFSRKAD